MGGEGDRIGNHVYCRCWEIGCGANSASRGHYQAVHIMDTIRVASGMSQNVAACQEDVAILYSYIRHPVDIARRLHSHITIAVDSVHKKWALNIARPGLRRQVDLNYRAKISNCECVRRRSGQRVTEYILGHCVNLSVGRIGTVGRHVLRAKPWTRTIFVGSAWAVEEVGTCIKIAVDVPVHTLGCGGAGN